ncbi:putative quinol monooxygenase YgiN [Posidoniimonas corsicana]|uniref:Putative quinol monooxygenase YgiN n=1 Tax=Posidoniimonas corsicana TaxID=1938618 RepID=A0A5C5VBV5_9BACT|nr:putative quinol monooxygenase [Posidoniimonas corsicana]TWT36048.1 putative quinol monooxygenase YgiN [Posidoniimonas corsicana]
MIHVVATITLKPGVRAGFLEAFARLTPLVRAEEGCIEYGATVDEPTGMDVQQLAGEDAVVVVEKWASTAALEAHLAAPHMDAYRQETADMTTGVTLLVLKPA